jgi:hypothetical protein
MCPALNPVAGLLSRLYISHILKVKPEKKVELNKRISFHREAKRIRIK